MTVRTAERPGLLGGYAFAVLVMLIWATFALASRYSARTGGGAVPMTPWDLGALRFAVAGVVAAGLWLAGYGRGMAVGRGLLLAALAGPGFALFAYVGFSIAPAAHGAVLLAGTLPFWVAAGTWAIFGERWSRLRFISMGLLLAGLLLIGIEAYGHGAAPAGAWRGDLCFVAASVCWAGYTILARRWVVPALQSVVVVGLGGALLVLPVWVLVLPSHLGAVPRGEILFQAAYQGLLAVVISLFLYTRALASIGVARLTTITALAPGIAGVLAAPVLGEALGPFTLAGLLLVCTAVAVGVRR